MSGMTEERLSLIEERWCDKQWGIAHPIIEEDLQSDVQDLVNEIRRLREVLELKESEYQATIEKANLANKVARDYQAENQRLREENERLVKKDADVIIGYALDLQKARERIAELEKENKQLDQELNGTEHKHGYKGMFQSCNSHVASLNSKISKLEKQLKGIGAEQYYDMRQRFWDSQKEVKRLEKEIESYPTRDAYESACKALWKHRDRNEQLEKQNAELSEVLRKLSPNVVYQALRHYDKQSLYKESEFMDLYAARDTQPEIIEVLRKYELEGEQ